jgi:monooxygenase
MAHEHVDVLVVGAGLSGIGAACHLRRNRPQDSVAILESRRAMGGTWDLFRYPGVRSDSDMHTLGYSFEPWTQAQAIADGPAILRYIRRTAAKYQVDRLVRYGHRVVDADWSSRHSRWTVTVQVLGDDGQTTSRTELTCRWLYLCTGYYRYDEGYTPEIPGLAEFSGRLVHPQHWPTDLDYTDRRVIVVGSGATAVTIVPEMARRAAHVTMLQRSPTYVVPRPTRDAVADGLQRVLPARAAHAAIRWKNALAGLAVYQMCRHRPDTMRRFFRTQQRSLLPADVINTHFTPSYDPWDQRLCLAPDGDLFEAVSQGRASVVTDTIRRVTPTGVLLDSGGLLPADVLVMATGLQLLAFGGAGIRVDGVERQPSEMVVYKGMMLSHVPNLAFAVGYTNASWTLKVDLVSEYVCRLLDYLDDHGLAAVVPLAPPTTQTHRPLLDLTSGYVERSLPDLPRQGSKAPWTLYQNYPRDVWMLRHGPVADEGVRFVRPAPPDTVTTGSSPALPNL